MDSYLFFLQVYKKYSNGRVVMDIYRNGGKLATVGLWAGAGIFFIAAITQFFTQHFAPLLLVTLCGGAIWGISFQRALRRYVSSVPGLSKDKANLFRLNYQYLRYHFFAAEVKGANREGDTVKALAFVNGLLETEHSTPVWSNPFVTTALAVALAVLGGAAGAWEAKYVLATIAISVVAVYFSAMTLAMRTPKEAKTKELKRYLLWMSHDKEDGATPAPGAGHEPAALSLVQKNMGVQSPDPGITAKTETEQNAA